MFDMNDIGKKIAKRRKELNLTQVELADQLLVSYQAVSQWELGKSMPELSNLTRLADILDIPLEELLGQKQSQVVQQVVEEEPLSDDDLVEAAPFIKPSAMGEQLKDRPFKSGTLIALAPFLDSETLMGYIKKQRVDSASVIALAPFLDDKHIDEMLESMSVGDISTSKLIGLAPFASSKTLTRLVLNAGNRISGTQLIGLAPFLKKKHLSQIIQAGQVQGLSKNWVRMGLAPFVDQEDLIRMLEAEEPDDVHEAVEPDDVDFIPEEEVQETTHHENPTDETLENLFEQLKRYFKSGK